MALFALLGVLGGIAPAACKDAGRGVQTYAFLSRFAGTANPCLSRHSLFRATAGATLRLRQGFAARVIRTKIALF